MTAPHPGHGPAGSRTAAQNRRFWRLVGELNTAYGGDHGELRARAVIREITRADGDEHDCSRRLTEGQAERVLAALAAEAARSTNARRVTEPDGPPSARQLETIQALRTQLGITPAGLRSLSERVCKKPWPQTRADAQKLHEALSSMLNRDMTKTIGAADSMRRRIAACQAAPGLTRWEQMFLRNLDHDLVSGHRVKPGALGKLIEIERTRLPLTPRSG